MKDQRIMNGTDEHHVLHDSRRREGSSASDVSVMAWAMSFRTEGQVATLFVDPPMSRVKALERA